MSTSHREVIMKAPLTRITLFASLAAAASLLTPLLAVQPPVRFDKVYAFGDSLSDTGNIFVTTKAIHLDPAVPPSEEPHRTYYRGRFSNGPVAVEYLWHLLSGNEPDTPGGVRPFLAAPTLGAHGAVSFAFGGTGTPTVDRTPGGLWAPGLKGQVGLFSAALGGRKVSKRSLYVISTGSNDYQAHAFNVPMTPPEVVANIVDAVDDLYHLGARDVMVFDLPDPSLLPGGDPAGAELATFHNQLLAQRLAELASVRRGLTIIPIHLNELFSQLPVLLPGMSPFDPPALDAIFPVDQMPPGFRMSQCLFIGAATCDSVPSFDVIALLGRPFVFWDVVHPTTDAHRLLGQFLYEAVQ
jgi:phospholipase/lecithinase/hemolysin